MKKLFVLALAAFAMVACVNEEVTELPQGDAIAFESAFIDNATRAAEDPSTTTETLDGFNVWGFVKECDGVIFNGTEVKKTNGIWGYEGTQYWAPNQPYYFAALAPTNGKWSLADPDKATGEKAKYGLGKISFTNENGTEDLLYAKTMKQSAGLNEPNGAVKFQFQHLLSKVKFTFKNGFPTETASIVVSNVKMAVPLLGAIDLAQADYTKGWSCAVGNSTVALEFGNVQKLAYTKSAEAAYERFTIPATDVDDIFGGYIITFDIDLYMGAQKVYTVSKTSKVTGYELEMGKAYNFTAEINPDNLELEEIVFDVHAVDGWVPEGGETVDVAFAELKAAAANGGTYTLYKDIDMPEALYVKGDLTLNLNGKKLYTSAPVGNPYDLALVNVAGANAKLTINGEGTVEAYADDVYTYMVEKGGELTINGGTHIGNISVGYVYKTGGTININGGYYDLKQKLNDAEPYKYLLNIQDTAWANGIGHIVVSGGEYVGFNPQNNTAEGAATNFLAEGYSAIAQGNNYVVIEADVVASTQSGLNDAVANEGSVYLEDGNYEMPAVSGKEFTISGSEDVVITVNRPAMHGSDLTFEGVTIVASGYTTGVQHVNTVTYNDVKVVGTMCLYGEKVVFNNCSFELSGDYIWCYGAKEVEFNNCVFDTTGKALLVYNEGAGANTVKVTNCVFNASAGAKAGAIANQNCAAIEIDNFQSSGVGAAHNVITSGNTYSENFSGEWRIKNYVAGNAVTVNGVAYTQIAVDGKLMTIDANRNVTVLE